MCILRFGKLVVITNMQYVFTKLFTFLWNRYLL